MNLKNDIAHSDMGVRQKVEYIKLVEELESKSQKLDFIEDFLYNGLGWSKEYIQNIFQNSLTKK